MDTMPCQLPVITQNNGEASAMGSHENARNGTDVSVADEKLATLAWLSPLTPCERHQAIRAGRVDKVGDWLLQTPEFLKWHQSEGCPANQVLLCYGAPGVGKTCLSSLVVDALCDRIDGGRDPAVAYIYCDFNAESEQSAATVLGALLKQVIAKLSQIPEGVQNALESAKDLVDGRGPQLPEILAVLTQSLLCFPRGFLCIDGLDEFPTKRLPELWESLKHVVRKCPNTRLFLTGRPHIRDEIQKCFPGGADAISISPTKEDIGTYATMRLKRDPGPYEMDEKLWADILKIVPEKVSETFLLVVLAMDSILAEVTIPRRRETLHKVANWLSLDDAYSMALARIRGQGGDRSKLGMDALMWACHSERPLEADELCHALGVGARGTDFMFHKVPPIWTVLGSTLGLVTIDEKSSTVRLLHFTLQEYLGKQPTLFAAAHSRMAEVCLTHLNSQYIRGLSSNLDIVLPTTPFLEYATCFWATHATMDVTESVETQALRLLDGYENHISANILLRKKRPWYLAQGHVEGFTGLHCIAFLGINDIARSMVETRRWDLNRRDSGASTPLLWAVTYGNEEVVKLFLEQVDTNPNVADGDGRTPLSLAAEWGREDIVELLLKRGDVNPDLPDGKGRTPLSFAADWGRVDVVKRLLECTDINPSSSDNNGHTPLSLASKRGQEAVVALLVERQANCSDPPDSKIQTPLPIPTMDSHGSTATPPPNSQNPNQELSNKSNCRNPPPTPRGNAPGQEPPSLPPEQENTPLPTADPNAAATCTISRSTLIASPEKQPVPPPPPPPPPKISRGTRSVSPAPISLNPPTPITPAQAETGSYGCFFILGTVVMFLVILICHL